MSSRTHDLSSLMWSEKYRPGSLRELVNQAEIVKGITNLMKSRALPHMLFAGPAGVGKTTAALCIAKELLGQSWERNTLRLNASDERGIRMVREKVKGFASWSSPAGDQEVTNLFKIIILDEADEMTSEAQTALRTIIEDSSRNTRFIIVCNYLSQIIDPIQSRCVVFRFTALTKDDLTEYLRTICERENKRFEERALAQIYEVARGDLRYSINILQAAAGMGNITISNVNVAAGISGKTKVREVLQLALAGKFNDARAKLLELTQAYGMSESDFIRYANQEVYEMKIDDAGELAQLMAEYDYRLTAGAHPDIQLAAFLAQLGRINKK